MFTAYYSYYLNQNIKLTFTSAKWNDYENRLQFFKMFAKENGFDPLLPANWYSISASQLRARTVCYFSLFTFSFSYFPWFL